MHYAQERHCRRSPRLPGYDYAQPGGYYVTIYTFDREPLLGKIVDDDIRLSTSGEIVKACWNHLPEHYPLVQLDAFVIMPNHVRGIILLLDEEVARTGLEPDARADVGAGLSPPLRHPSSRIRPYDT